MDINLLLGSSLNKCIQYIIYKQMHIIIQHINDITSNSVLFYCSLAGGRGAGRKGKKLPDQEVEPITSHNILVISTAERSAPLVCNSNGGSIRSLAYEGTCCSADF